MAAFSFICLIGHVALAHAFLLNRIVEDRPQHRVLLSSNGANGRNQEIDRRDWIRSTVSLLSLGFPAATLLSPTRAKAADALASQVVEMKDFVDPAGLFVMRIPKRFFALRRSAKGDLPDDKGVGRRGATLFTAGDLGKAEVIAVERCVTKDFPSFFLLTTQSDY